jgi:hypothetical protein
MSSQEALSQTDDSFTQESLRGATPPTDDSEEQGQGNNPSSTPTNLVFCESCGREWDGNAQCPCGIGYFIDSSGDNDIATSWGQVAAWIQEYEGEYEIDEDPPENNSQIVTEIKGTVQQLGEKLFESKEKLPEGEYLTMMDLLQNITNKVNSL